MAKFERASRTKWKNAQSSERGMNQGVIGPSAKPALTAKKPNPSANVCRAKKQTNLFVGEASIIDSNIGNTSDYSFFIGHTNNMKNGI